MPFDPRDLGPPDRLLHRRLLELEQERWRRVCRGNLLAFSIEALAPKGMRPARHDELFCNEIAAVTNGQTPKPILIAPRGSTPTAQSRPWSKRSMTNAPAWRLPSRYSTEVG